MAYQSLARKYRPASFSDLVGQDAVAKALASAITLGREQAALLLTGVRGVGKTTIARLYAKALNCEARGPGAEPCDRCESCLAIATGRHEDVLEIDGASNTGVADVRALQETVDYAPQRSTFKVYIIDEVHMLSAAAFNALLKTIEEPPPHVKFVFATTEVGRVPETILSRCQAFYLKKLTTAVIQARLAEILRREDLAFEEKALTVIAREGHGSMRDALTLLDQAIALGDGRVTLATLGSIVGGLSSSPYIALIEAMVARDASAAMATVAGLDEGGAEFRTVVEEAATCARHAFVLKGLGPKALDGALLGLDDTEMSRLGTLAQGAAEFDLNRIFRTLAHCRLELDGSALDRFVLENYLYEWCFDPGMPDIESLRSLAPSATAPATPRAERSSLLEGLKVATAPAPGPVPTVSAQPASMPPAAVTPAAVVAPVPAHVAPVLSTPAPAVSVEAVPRWPATWRDLVDRWKAHKPLSARKLEEVHVLEYSPTRIALAVNEASYVSKSMLLSEEQTRVREAFRDLFGFTGTLSVVPRSAEAAARAGALAAETPAPVAPAAARDPAPATTPIPAFQNSAPMPPSPSPAAPLTPETLLETRTREGAARRAQLVEDAKNAPFTRDLVAALGGKVEDVRIPDKDPTAPAPK